MNSLKPLTKKKKLPFVRRCLKFEMLQKSDIINNARSPDKKDRQIMIKKKKKESQSRSPFNGGLCDLNKQISC